MNIEFFEFITYVVIFTDKSGDFEYLFNVMVGFWDFQLVEVKEDPTLTLKENPIGKSWLSVKVS